MGRPKGSKTGARSQRVRRTPQEADAELRRIVKKHGGKITRMGGVEVFQAPPFDHPDFFESFLLAAESLPEDD